jgi:hypothetical protein
MDVRIKKNIELFDVRDGKKIGTSLSEKTSFTK